MFLCAISIAETNFSSSISLAEDSIINTESLVPAITKSNSDFSNSSVDGLSTNSSSINPTLTAASKLSKGTSEIFNAAADPIIAKTSVGKLPSYDKTLQKTLTSYKKSSGNKGLIGLSINLEINVSLSEGLPSLFINPPGNFPAA